MPFTFQNVSYVFQGQPILDGISCSLSPGKFYGILGPNGSGKTSFLDLLIGHKKPSSGCLRYKDGPLQAFRKKRLAREIALVPQDFGLNFPFTVEEVVLMGRYPHLPRFKTFSSVDLDIVYQSLMVTGTLHLKDKYITQLSGGEKQRVIFARALAQQTPVLLLDEATSNVDVRYRLQLLQYVQRKNMQEKQTVIAVFQDINLAARFCDHLLFIKQGQIFAQGPIEEILCASTLKDVFDVEAKIFFEKNTKCRQVIFEIESES